MKRQCHEKKNIKVRDKKKLLCTNIIFILLISLIDSTILSYIKDAGLEPGLLMFQNGTLPLSHHRVTPEQINPTPGPDPLGPGVGLDQVTQNSATPYKFIF
jgi:hypothetical protein